MALRPSLQRLLATALLGGLLVTATAQATVVERIVATVGERADADGPVAWVLLIPTMAALMESFVAGEITEQALYERTPVDIKYDAVYLCSAMVLEEHRRKGLAKQLTLDALEQIRKDHPITSLFCWPFTPGGDALAGIIAKEAGLPLRMRAR